MKILDQHGNPIDTGALKEPQTSRIATLENQYLTPMLAGLTPSRLASILRSADDGDLTAQHRLFADMEERDAHLYAEMMKRKLAVMGLDWDIVPPRNATAKEKADAEWVKEVLTDAIDPIEDLILALMEGVGHGFAPVELEWRQEGREWLPAFFPRPQEWFRLSQNRRELRLLDAGADGTPMQSFGWVLHTHGKPKTGYMGRMGLHRTLVWPFLYKAYALGDFAEFLETYGLPMVVGKYYQGASAEEKASLMRAVTALGHDARAIMPADMQLEIQKVTGGGDSTPHLAMMGWADSAESKAILGQTMSAEAKASGLGSGNAQLHGEVRDDIRNADARQIAGTITLDLIYSLLALNRGIDSPRRCSRLVFDTGEAEDLAALADSVGKLVTAGMRTIPVAWVHERGRIPQPEGNEPTLAPPAPEPPEGRPEAALAALKAERGEAPPWAALAADQLAAEADPAVAAMLDKLQAMVETAASLDELRAMIEAAWPRIDQEGMTVALRAAFAAADLQGRYEIKQETAE